MSARDELFKQLEGRFRDLKLSEEEVERVLYYVRDLTELQGRKIAGHDVSREEAHVVAQINAEFAIRASRVRNEIMSFMQTLLDVVFDSLFRVLT